MIRKGSHGEGCTLAVRFETASPNQKVQKAARCIGKSARLQNNHCCASCNCNRSLTAAFMRIAPMLITLTQQEYGNYVISVQVAGQVAGLEHSEVCLPVCQSSSGPALPRVICNPKHNAQLLPAHHVGPSASKDQHVWSWHLCSQICPGLSRLAPEAPFIPCRNMYAPGVSYSGEHGTGSTC